MLLAGGGGVLHTVLANSTEPCWFYPRDLVALTETRSHKTPHHTSAAMRLLTLEVYFVFHMRPPAC